MTTLNKKFEILRYSVLPPKLYYRFRAWRTWVRCRHYSEPEIRLLRFFVDRGRNSVDVGANKGVYTYFLERLSKHVFAYEPNPKFTPILERVVGPKVTLVQAALSDHTGEASLTIPIGPKGESNNAATLETGKFDWEVKELTVPVMRLDDTGHDDIGFVKIDVEGHEEADTKTCARPSSWCARSATRASCTWTARSRASRTSRPNATKSARARARAGSTSRTSCSSPARNRSNARPH
jgi:FkbM family methyltransferase